LSSRSGIITSGIIVALVFAGIGGFLYMTDPFAPRTVAVVVMEPGFGDLSFADHFEEGLENLRGDIPIEYRIPEELPSTQAEAVQILESLAQSQQHTLILAAGERLEGALASVAADYPSQEFAIIGGVVEAENVASATFATEQAAFLAGALAAFVASEPSYTDIIGILGATEEDAAITRMINGFIQGVQNANSTYDFNVQLLEPEYLNGYNETALAESKTQSMFTQQNVSIIFAPVRAAINGVRQGMANVNATLRAEGRLPLVIGAEANQDYYGCANPEIPVAPSWIPTSVVPRTGEAAYDIINATLWNDFPGGKTFHYNLSNGGVNVTDFEYSSTYLNPIDGLMDALRDYKIQIIAGTLEINP
jgi:basic membrane protein A